MKKVYEPLNMIMNGRYAVLYGKLAPAIQQEVLSRMAGLIEEERDYEDKGWKYVCHPEDPKEYYHFETLECIYKYEFSKHGVLERFGPMFCRSDIIKMEYHLGKKSWWIWLAVVPKVISVEYSLY